MSLAGPFPIEYIIKSMQDGEALLNAIAYRKRYLEGVLAMYPGDDDAESWRQAIAILDRLECEVLMACGDD